MVNNGGHFVVRTDLQKFRFELISCLNVDRVDIVFQFGFMKHDVDLVSIRCWPGVDVNHEIQFPC